MGDGVPRTFRGPVAPCSGAAGDANDVQRIKGHPGMDFFMAKKDAVVPVEEARKHVRGAEENRAGRVKMAIYPELGHSAWKPGVSRCGGCMNGCFKQRRGHPMQPTTQP